MRRFVGFKQLHDQYGCGRKANTFRVWLGRQIRAGRWPAPIRLGENTVAWDTAELEAAVAKLPRSAYRNPQQAV
jgi:predicted DNA-binding transcriptional regulator AlpA